MSVVRDPDGSSILEQIPVELWSKIISADQGFTIEDFKTLCFVSPLFNTVCQPLVYTSLAVRGANEPGGYTFEGRWGKRRTTYYVGQWKRDVAGLIRAERRLRLIGDDPSLSTFPRTISIGVTPESARPNLFERQLLKVDKMDLWEAARETFTQFMATLLRTLPLFTRLRRLEVASFPINDELLRVIASHPTLHELKLGACSFSSPTFCISSIRFLECSKVWHEHAPAAFLLASSQHLEELRIEDMAASAILKGLRARPESELRFTSLYRLTIVRSATRLTRVELETLLTSMPALRQLDIDEVCWTTVQEGDRTTMNLSTIPSLERVSGPWSCARYIVPGRPVTDIRCRNDYSGSFAETRAELRAYLNPLCLSTAGAENITTLHLPHPKVAPIWLLSQFVVETFPRVVDLSLPVGMVKARDRLLVPPSWSIDSSLFSSDDEPLDFELQFDEGTIEGMVKNIREIVENELVGGSDDSHPRAKGVDYATRAVSSCPAAIPISASSPKVNIATILARFCTDVVLDSAGTPSRHPKNYQEALIYFTRGWYPLPAGIQTLSLRLGHFPGDRTYPHPFGRLRTVTQRRCVAIVTALGERYPSLGSVTFMGSTGYRCERIRGTGLSGTSGWSVFEQ